jgi:very-short-patch-repair endonuclease
MNKKDYIIRQISKTNKKNYENYVVTGVWHLLNDLDIKFVTQQYVIRPNGFALTDMFFPQINFHIEIDEPHHKRNIENDLTRETDIIDATNHRIKRIAITDDLHYINLQIKATVVEILTQIDSYKNENKFENWDLDKEFDPNYYKNKGKITVEQGAMFKNIAHACNCFGHNYDGYQKGWAKNNLNNTQYLWFPKFYENKEWDNKISDDGSLITERCKTENLREAHFNRSVLENIERVTFPRAKDNLGFTFYRFKGIFKIDKELSNLETGVVFRRIKTEVSIG